MRREEVKHIAKSLLQSGTGVDARYTRPVRVGKCQAYIQDAMVGDSKVVVVRSYKTIVAMYDWEENMLYSFGRFSATTYQHIRKARDIIAYRRGIAPWDITEENLELVNWFK